MSAVTVTVSTCWLRCGLKLVSSRQSPPNLSGNLGTYLYVLFHTGGVAQIIDITCGLPRVQEILKPAILKGKQLSQRLKGCYCLSKRMINSAKKVFVKVKLLCEYIVPIYKPRMRVEVSHVARGDAPDRRFTTNQNVSLQFVMSCQRMYLPVKYKKFTVAKGRNRWQTHRGNGSSNDP